MLFRKKDFFRDDLLHDEFTFIIEGMKQNMVH